MRRYWQLVASGCLLTAASDLPAFADERCQLVADSYLGQILDARLPLGAVSANQKNTRVGHALPDNYKHHGIPYTEMHERILVEPILSGESSYVAISSIGVFNQKEMTVLFEINSNGDVRFKPCDISATPAPVIKPESLPERVLTAPEILSKLLVLLGIQQDFTQAEIMAELRRLRSSDPLRPDERRLIIALSEKDLDKSFMKGLRALMTFEEEQLFEQNLKHGAVVAVTDSLFSLAGKSLLNRLMRQGLPQKPLESKAVSTQVLQQQLAAMGNQLAYVRSEAMLQDNKAAIAAEPRGNLVLEIFYQWAALPYTWWGIALVSGMIFVALIGRYIARRRAP